MSADPLDGSYRYHTLGSSITLSANTSYLIGALVGTNGTTTTEYWGDSNDPARSPSTPDAYSGSSLASLIEPRVAFQQNTLTAPTTNGGGAGSRWAPANFEATVVPEPASLSLLGLGALGLLARRRRA